MSKRRSSDGLSAYSGCAFNRTSAPPLCCGLDIACRFRRSNDITGSTGSPVVEGSNLIRA